MRTQSSSIIEPVKAIDLGKDQITTPTLLTLNDVLRALKLFSSSPILCFPTDDLQKSHMTLTYITYLWGNDRGVYPCPITHVSHVKILPL